MEQHKVRLTAGRSRTKTAWEENERKNESASRVLFLIGTVFVCAALLLPMGKEKPKVSSETPPNAVAVMSSGVTTESEQQPEREQLVKPEEKKTSASEWSLFDAIGELFAELIFGERE